MTFNLPGPYKGKFQFTDCLLEFQFTADQFISIYHALILDFKSKFIDGDFNLPNDSISIYPATQLTIIIPTCWEFFKQNFNLPTESQNLNLPNEL